MEWIKITKTNNYRFIKEKDNHPKYGELVIVVLEATINPEEKRFIRYATSARYCCCEGWIFDNPKVMPKESYIPEAVIYWMPLPEIPKE